VNEKSHVQRVYFGCSTRKAGAGRGSEEEVGATAGRGGWCAGRVVLARPVGVATAVQTPFPGQADTGRLNTLMRGATT